MPKLFLFYPLGSSPLGPIITKYETPQAVRLPAEVCTDAESLGLLHQDLGSANGLKNRP